MKTYFYFLTLLIIICCYDDARAEEKKYSNSSIASDGTQLNRQPFVENPLDDSISRKIQFLISELKKPVSNYVMVVAHRGDWRNAPENSILSLRYAAEAGVDMVEVDVKKTKDNILVAMHDFALDRTTTGKGLVADHTLAQLKELKLRNGGGGRTRHDIPTIKEYMLEALRLGVLVNLDKGIEYAKEIGEVLKETGTAHIAVVKSGMDPVELQKIVPLLGGAHFMPVIGLDRDKNPKNKITQLVKNFKPSVMEVSFQHDTSFFFRRPAILTEQGVKIWNTSCSFMWCSGYDDEMAVEFNRPDESWGWLLRHGATIFLTDRPREMIKYLDQKGLRKRNSL